MDYVRLRVPPPVSEKLVLILCGVSQALRMLTCTLAITGPISQFVMQCLKAILKYPVPDQVITNEIGLSRAASGGTRTWDTRDANSNATQIVLPDDMDEEPLYLEDIL